MDTQMTAQYLEALHAIRELKARYFRCMDVRAWRAAQDVFTDDIVMDMRQDVATLAKSVCRSNRGRPRRRARGGGGEHAGGARRHQNRHYGHMSEIELISDVETMKIWAMEDIVVLPDGAPFGRIDGHCH